MKMVLQLLCIWLCIVNSALAAANGVLAAYGTSYSNQSSFVTDLINKNYSTIEAGIFWEPKSKDNGINEGVYIQFDNPITVDEVNIFTNGMDGNVTVYYDGTEGHTYWQWLNKKRELTNKHHPFNRTLFNSSLKDTQKAYYRNAILESKTPTSQDLKDDTYKKLTELSNVMEYALFPNEKKYEFKSIFIKLNHKTPITGRIYAIEFKNNGKLVPIKIPQSVPTKATASSILSPQQSYDISNIADSQLTMAWSTDGAKSTGVGESFQFEFDSDAIPTLNGLLIWNGYQRSESHFNANGRVQTLNINGDSITVRDRLGVQEFMFTEPKQSQQLTVTIESIYPGTKYKDVLISELSFIGTDNRILPVIKKPKAKMHTEIEKIVDQSFSSLGIVNQQQFPINSDNSYVYKLIYENSLFEKNIKGYISKKHLYFGGQIRNGVINTRFKKVCSPEKSPNKHYMSQFDENSDCVIDTIPLNCFVAEDSDNNFIDKNNNGYPDCMEKFPDFNNNKRPDIFEDPDFFTEDILVELIKDDDIYAGDFSNKQKLVTFLNKKLGTPEELYLNNTHFFKSFKVDETENIFLNSNDSRDCDVNYSSLKLRSNGTFVLYDRSDKDATIIQAGNEMDACEAIFPATIMEGNWESLSNHKIRLFGKKYDSELSAKKNSGYYSYIAKVKEEKKEKPHIFQTFVTIKPYTDLSVTEKQNAIALVYQSAPEKPFFYAHISYQSTIGIPECKSNLTIQEYVKQYACEDTGIHFFSESKKGLFQKLDQFFETVNPIYFKSKEFTTLFFPTNEVNETFTSVFIR
ncbi:hypothetical protein DID76_01500 [Candidatus Marinamargulisbacteria bacterium SCGC AG-414-C22]|nr:hypothetical protein DID76_01500 [Candidatus Marinamargulisbacteria bacterium SCGC AG-414-C22]